MEVLVCLAAGVLIFGFSPGGANLPGAFLIILLTVSSVIGFGMVSAGITLIIKKGTPVGQVFSLVSELLSGTYFPLTLLPLWLDDASAFIPLTHSLKALRLLILRGQPVGEVLPEILALIGFSVVMIPVGMVFITYSLRKAKMDGSLVQY